MFSSKILAKCLLWASLQNQVPTDALLAIMEVEGGRAGLEVRNANGTHDLGLMQINTCWLPELARSWSIPSSQVRRLIRDNDCLNIMVAAHILKTKIREAQGDILQGIARYNNANPRYGRPYLGKVIHAYFNQNRRVDLSLHVIREKRK
jgi:soluble lytic murein transglycosylase-like protein